MTTVPPQKKLCCGYSQKHLTEALLMTDVPPQKGYTMGTHKSTSQSQALLMTIVPPQKSYVAGTHRSTSQMHFQ